MGFENRNVFSHETSVRNEIRVYFLQFLSAVSHFLVTSLRGNVTVLLLLLFHDGLGQ